MDSSVTALANVIQLAVAPVFLLAGIAGFLNVMSGRLGRIVDRARVLEMPIVSPEGIDNHKGARQELNVLWRRTRIINGALGMCTASGLMVCCVVVCLFIGDFWNLDLAAVIVGLFVLALVFLIGALVFFLVEVHQATKTLKMRRTEVQLRTDNKPV